MPLPEAIHVVMLTRARLRTKSALDGLLRAFESIDELAPTNWGRDERARNPYDRKEMIETIVSGEFGPYVPGLRRSTAPRYQAYFWARDDGLKQVRVEFGSTIRKKDTALIFRLGDNLAKELEPEYGMVHLIWRKEDKDGSYSIASMISATEFQECGPTPPTARTWFGKRLVDLIGIKKIEEAGALTRETSWGGLQMDLVAGPWEADFKTLSTRQGEAMEILEPSGIFGDHGAGHHCKPGPKWSALSEDGK